MESPPKIEHIDNISSWDEIDTLHVNSEVQKLVLYKEFQSDPANIIRDDHESGTESVFNNLALMSPLVSSMGIYRLTCCNLMGQAFLFKDDCLLNAPDLLPDYVRHTVEAGKQWEINPALPVRKIEGCFVVTVSNAYQVYGHWIVDILPRLWLAMNHCPSGINLSIVLPTDTPSYAISIIEKLFGEKNYVYHDIYRENLDLEEVYSPSLLHNSHYFHFAINDFVSFVVNHDFMKNSQKLNTKSGKHIYITRQKFRDSSSSYVRSIINEDDVLKSMRELGFEIVSPEDFSWEDQVKIFSDAKIIIGEAGSAMHNTVFSGEGAIVICLNPTNHLQSSIAAIRKQKIMSICSDFESFGDNIKYHIDVERLCNAAKSAIAQTSTN